MLFPLQTGAGAVVSEMVTNTGVFTTNALPGNGLRVPGGFWGRILCSECAGCLGTS